MKSVQLKIKNYLFCCIFYEKSENKLRITWLLHWQNCLQIVIHAPCSPAEEAGAGPCHPASSAIILNCASGTPLPVLAVESFASAPSPLHFRENSSMVSSTSVRNQTQRLTAIECITPNRAISWYRWIMIWKGRKISFDPITKHWLYRP